MPHSRSTASNADSGFPAARVSARCRPRRRTSACALPLSRASRSPAPVSRSQRSTRTRGPTRSSPPRAGASRRRPRPRAPRPVAARGEWLDDRPRLGTQGEGARRGGRGRPARPRERPANGRRARLVAVREPPARLLDDLLREVPERGRGDRPAPPRAHRRQGRPRAARRALKLRVIRSLGRQRS